MADAQKNILINIDLETGQVNSQLDEIDGKIGNLGNNLKVETFKSVRSEILAAREEAVRLAVAISDAEEAGQNVDNLQKRYAEVTNRAAQLKDAVEDTNKSIANANPDNRLQGLVSIAQGAVVAIQGVASAFTLVGVDAETAQVAVAKLQAIIGLSSALSSIEDIKNGYADLARNINLTAVAQRVNNGITVAAAAIQRTFTGSVVATGTAFRALRVAIAGTGIGLLVVAIAAAVIAIKEFIDATNDAKRASEEFNNTLDNTISKYDDLVAANQRSGALILAELKARGASEQEQRAAQLKTAENQLRLSTENVLELQRQFDEQISKRRPGLLGFLFGPGVTEEDLQKASGAIKDALNQQTQAQQDVRIQEANNRAADLADQQRRNAQKIQNQTTTNERSKRLVEDLKRFILEQNIILQEQGQSDAQNEIDRVERVFKEKENIARAEIRKKKELTAILVELEKIRQAQITTIQQNAAKQAQREQNQIQIESTAKRIEIVNQRLLELTKLNNTNLQAEISDNVEILRDLYDTNFQFRKKQIEDEAQLQIDAIAKLQLSATEQANLQKAVQETTKLQIQAIEQERDKNKAQLNLNINPVFELNEQRLQEANRRLSQVISEQVNLTFNTVYVQRQKEFNAALREVEAERENLLIRAQVSYEANRAANESLLNQGLITEQEFNNRQIQLAIKTNLRKNEILRESLKEEFNIRKQAIDTFNLLSQPLGTAFPGGRSLTRNLLASAENKRIFDLTLKQNEEFFKAAVDQENAAFIAERDRRIQQNEEIESLEKQHAQNLQNIEATYADNVATINDAVLQNKLSLVNSVGDAIGNLGRLFKQGSKEAKIAAVAEIAINTATGFVQGLDLAQKTARAAPPPAIPFVFAAFYASQVAAVLGAAARAKQILAKLPGEQPATDTGPTTPSAVNASLFNLPQQVQNVRVTGQPSQVVRAFITTSDLTTAQERADFLNKLSRF